MRFERERELAKDMARLAGLEILEYYAREIIAEEKLGVDLHYEPVTAADRAASRLIVAGIEAVFPEDAILSEEEQDIAEKRLGRERVWVIDPIDGTAGFVKKDGDFAVQIGFAVRGEAVAGVVLLPYHDVMYSAAKGAGAWRESGGKIERIETSRESDLTKMTIAVSRNHRSPKMKAIKREFRVKGEVDRGSVGLKVGLLAEKQADLYIHLSPRTKLWDTCAPQIILEEAGGRMTDLFGEEFRYDVEDLQNHGGIVATNGVVHDEVIRRLKPLLREFGRLRYRPKAAA
jgi:3'(2'), 5'-bisphosphate nucleotidase